MKTNVQNRSTACTHEGGPALTPNNPEKLLSRLVSSCLLWESEFYVDGKTIADQIAEAAHRCDPDFVARLAGRVRNEMNLRHVALQLVVCYFSHPKRTGSNPDWTQAIQRADEIAELVALWWKDGRRKLPAGMKRGLASAFHRFSAYQFAKYDRDGAVKLRDVMFLVHPKPRDEAEAATFKQIAERTLPSPETWEVLLSAGVDKRATFEYLIREGKIGYLALLRNLRNMVEARCDLSLVRAAIIIRKGADRVLPFRYVAAARACPALEREIDLALLDSIRDMPPLRGTTAVLVDVSGSMDRPLSSKGDLTRIDAACALASIVPAENLRVFSFSNNVVEVPPRRGLAGVEAIARSQHHAGTELGKAVELVNKTVDHDRLIVITDEQACDYVPPPVAKRAYMINVASYQNGVGYGPWTRIDGFSESVIRFIREVEE